MTEIATKSIYNNIYSYSDQNSDRGVKGQVGGSIPTGNNPPSMNGRRRVMGWGALGCSNLTASGAQGGVARDVTNWVTNLLEK